MAAQAVKLKWNVGTIVDGTDTANLYEVNTNLGERMFAFKTVVGGVDKWQYASKRAILEAVDGKRAFVSRRLDFSRFFDIASLPEAYSTGGYLTVSNEPTGGAPRVKATTSTYFSILGEGVDAPDLNGNGIPDGTEPETDVTVTDTPPTAGFMGGLEAFFTKIKEFVEKNPIPVLAGIAFLFFTKPGKKIKNSVLKTVGLGGKGK